MNLLNQAITNGETKQFLEGNGMYRIKSPDIDEHWVLGSWNQDILPYLETNPEFKLSDLFNVFTSMPFNFKSLSLMTYHLHVLFYFIKEDRIRIPDDIYGILNLYSECFEKTIPILSTDESKLLESSIIIIKRNAEYSNISFPSFFVN